MKVVVAATSIVAWEIEPVFKKLLSKSKVPLPEIIPAFVVSPEIFKVPLLAISPLFVKVLVTVELPLVVNTLFSATDKFA